MEVCGLHAPSVTPPGGPLNTRASCAGHSPLLGVGEPPRLASQAHGEEFSIESRLRHPAHCVRGIVVASLLQKENRRPNSTS
ncbi:hypothetical protein [Phaffia rhodozyma]|uniref:Uncharacterized protein n=1 Tax=Phaffia rhodozyma TaxID=264483 RepID=A0A0F7SK84_PHARH|nr:hypothetical protein [Phaffia rhodozyma]